MQESNDYKVSMIPVNFDYYRVITDILKKWWMILMVSVAVSLLSYIVAKETYHPQYTVSATYVITTKGTNTSVFSNLSTARDTAARFSQIINSTTLQKKVSEDLGSAGVPGVISAEIVPETNLMNFSVTSSTPQMAFRIMQSVMNNYKSISDYMIGNAIMEVLQVPEIPDRPDVELRVSVHMGKAFIITFLVMIVLIGLISCLRDTIRKSSDVEQKLDAKLIGTIAHEVKYKSIRSRLHKKDTSLLITNPATSFRYVESIKRIAAKISGQMDRIEAKTLFITSYMENEGKSTVSANVALALSQNNKKVLLMDIDLRKPSQYKIFDVQNKEMQEFGEILSGGTNSENLIGKIEHTNLYTIFNSNAYANSSDLVAAGRMPRLLRFLKKYFDYIIIDTPPMALVSDTEEIADISDASVVVVKEHNSDAKDINDMIDVLSGCKSTFLGCILNDAHAGIFNITSGYGSYYEKKYEKHYEVTDK